MKIFVARQPIVNIDRKPFGYEFLYRDSDKNYFSNSIDGTTATRTLISNLMSEFELNGLTGGRPAFINFTEDLIREEYIDFLPSDEIVVEILENVKSDADIVKRVKELKNKGYTIALDDFTGSFNELSDLADIIKVDFRLTDTEKQQEIALKYSHKKLLAEKIETEDELDRAQSIGYSLFQGYYFSKPVVVSKTATQIASATYLRLLREINKPYADFDSMADIIYTDVNMTYKFLAKINTLSYYRGHRVDSIRHALVRIGLLEIKRWMTVILMYDIMDTDKSTEPAKQALTRAVFAESIAKAIGRSDISDEAYMTGLFSMIDTIMDDTMENLLSKLSIPDSVKSALSGRKCLLRDILDFVIAYDAGRWKKLDWFLDTYPQFRGSVSTLYLNATRYSEESFATLNDSCA